MLEQCKKFTAWCEKSNFKIRYFIHDCDSKFSKRVKEFFKKLNVELRATPVRSPDMNCFIERWIGISKQECLHHFAFNSQVHLDHILRDWIEYYNHYRPHQGLENKVLDATADFGKASAETAHLMKAKTFCGGLIKSYYIDEAA